MSENIDKQGNENLNDMDQETLEILSNPDWVKIIEEGKEEVRLKIKGISLDELEDL